MKAYYTDRLLRSYGQAPLPVRKAFDKQVQLLLSNIRHPSLRAKKYDERRNIWQARVTRGWRFYFTIEGDNCHIIEMMAHPKK